MTSATRPAAGQANAAFVSWLVTGGIGPALVALPVNLVADKLAGAAVRWFKRLRQTDDLSRLVKAAAGISVQLSRVEIRDLRQLLEEEQTWRLLAAGKLNEKLQELIGQIAACLPVRDGLITEDARKAASAIARGLLEFAIFDLQPEVFQKVVMVRLQQMSDQATAVDEALFRLHKDLYVFAEDAKYLFRQVMDRLPPERADLGAVRIYLTALIDWLNTDPWPQDPRLGGHRLIPAAMERKLQLAAVGLPSKHDTAADDLASQCNRLVILGGPGSGKTWLAMRTARLCAEKALAALDEMTLDEVELPLYTTCSRLARTPGDIRKAAVSSAIEWMGDLGGSRIAEALCLLFTEREEPSLLVIDSLDEASDSDATRGRLRQVGSFLPPWRIVLTSRPSSWRNQLNLDDTKPDQRVCELKPLRYPDDVELVVQSWFIDRPEQGKALAAQIARQPSLQQGATVPLILAFYCMLGSQQLPESRRELYDEIINRMLHAPWRTGSGQPPDLDACRAVLRTWAWEAAQKNHPVSGVGQWEDDISMQQAGLSAAGQIAVDHIAAPRGGPGFDTSETQRSFTHRSIREHLVADYIAQNRSLDEAVEDLLPHLWYDPDWEYSAPAAVARHPQREDILRELIHRSARSAHFPEDLSVIDAGLEFSVFLARIAAESTEIDWSPELAGIIGRARVELAMQHHFGDLGWAPHWENSNRTAREELLRCLSPERGSFSRLPAESYLRLVSIFWAGSLTYDLVQLDPTAEDKRQAREAILRWLASLTGHGSGAERLVGGLMQLDPTAEDKCKARGALIALLTRQQRPYDRDAIPVLVGGLVQLAPTPEDKRQLRETLLEVLPSLPVEQVTAVLLQLVPTAEDKRQVREALLELLGYWHIDGHLAGPLSGCVTKLAITAEDKHEASEALFGLLNAEVDGWKAALLAGSIVQLDPTAGSKRQAMGVLIRLLDEQQHEIPTTERLVDGIIGLEPTAEDKQHVRRALLRLLVGATDLRSASCLAACVIMLDPSEEDKKLARRALLGLFARETDVWLASQFADGLAQLATTPEERRQDRETLLGLLATQTDGFDVPKLVYGVFYLAPTMQDKTDARNGLLQLLAAQTDNVRSVEGLVAGVVQLTPTAEDKQQTRNILFDMLASKPSWIAARLLRGIVQLGPTGEDKRRARDTLLKWLADQSNRQYASLLAWVLVQFEPTAEERRQSRQMLFKILADTADQTDIKMLDVLIELDPTTDGKREIREILLTRLRKFPVHSSVTEELINWPMTGELIDWVVKLSPTAADERQIRQWLLKSLAVNTQRSVAAEHLSRLIQLKPTAEDERQARKLLLSLKTRSTDGGTRLEQGIVQLNPTIRDLVIWRISDARPSSAMLAAARQNSALADWLAALPSLASLSRSP